jgi:hypothetical protein
MVVQQVDSNPTAAHEDDGINASDAAMSAAARETVGV